MKVFINENHEIKDVGTTTLADLTEVEIADETNPFAEWSKAKICCYKVDVADGIVTMMTPYIDTRIIPQIEHIGESNFTDGQIDILDFVESQLGVTT